MVISEQVVHHLTFRLQKYPESILFVYLLLLYEGNKHQKMLAIKALIKYHHSIPELPTKGSKKTKTPGSWSILQIQNYKRSFTNTVGNSIFDHYRKLSKRNSFDVFEQNWENLYGAQILAELDLKDKIEFEFDKVFFLTSKKWIVYFHQNIFGKNEIKPHICYFVYKQPELHEYETDLKSLFIKVSHYNNCKIRETKTPIWKSKTNEIELIHFLNNQNKLVTLLRDLITDE